MYGDINTLEAPVKLCIQEHTREGSEFSAIEEGARTPLRSQYTWDSGLQDPDVSPGAHLYRCCSVAVGVIKWSVSAQPSSKSQKKYLKIQVTGPPWRLCKGQVKVASQCPGL